MHPLPPWHSGALGAMANTISHLGGLPRNMAMAIFFPGKSGIKWARDAKNLPFFKGKWMNMG